MIINEIFKRPILNFGLGKVKKSLPLGNEITIWQNELYNEDFFILESDFGTVESTNKITYSPSDIGIENIKVTLKNTLTGHEIISNPIDLTTFIKADTTMKTSDNNIITSDYNG
jgi:hypothetical protein